MWNKKNNDAVKVMGNTISISLKQKVVLKFLLFINIQSSCGGICFLPFYLSL